MINKDLITALETNDFTKLQNIEDIKFIIGLFKMLLFVGIIYISLIN
jgi:hypothetical protein